MKNLPINHKKKIFQNLLFIECIRGYENKFLNLLKRKKPIKICFCFLSTVVISENEKNQIKTKTKKKNKTFNFLFKCLRNIKLFLYN